MADLSRLEYAAVPPIAAATVTAFYLFDIADQIDLRALRTSIGSGAADARLVPRSAAPSHLQYSTPPVVVDCEVLGIAAVEDFRVRAKFFDYGVLSLALTRPFSGEWAELIAAGQTYIDNDALEQRAAGICRDLVARFASTMSGSRRDLLTEDYLVVSVTSLDAALTADDLLMQHGEAIARMLRGERQPLSHQERDDVLRHRLSYFEDDLVVATWNAAFVYDTPAGAQAALEILELANSQLLEFRYYDDRLDAELGRIYSQLQRPPHWWDGLVGRGYIRAANHLQSLFIEVNEITDRTENALKIVGDIYAARLFQLTAARLALEPWKANVEEKLTTLNDIYRFAVEQVAIARGHFLELTIVLILIFELVLFFMGIMT
jgi:hypothetical protein